MYILTNGQIILEDEILKGYDLVIEDNIIKEIVKSKELYSDDDELIDVDNAYIAPGFIDIHSDYIENIASPRPTSMMDFNLSIREAEKVLVNTGITTMYHSLSFYGKDLFEAKPVRQEDNVKKLMNVICNTHNENHLIRHRFHARFEIDDLSDVDIIKEFVKDGKINLLSFMDHTPGQGQYRNIEIYKKTMKGYKNISDEEILQVVEEAQNKEKVELDVIKEMADLAKENNISIASHDDDSLEKVELMKEIGATISEFPINLDVAKKAKEEGFLVSVGAPNILLGGSHSGNLSAIEAIQNDVADILCSDYYPQGMLHAIFIMHKKYDKDLAAMFRLATINPAKAVKIDNELGSIKKGKKADLLIIKDDEMPLITSVFVDGKLTSKINYRK